MKMIINEKRIDGVERQAFLSGVVNETQLNVNRWLDFSHLTESEAKEKMRKDDSYSLRLLRNESGASVSIYAANGEQLGESIIYEVSDDFTFEEWAVDISLMLLYLAGNYGGNSFSEAVTDFLTHDENGLMPFVRVDSPTIFDRTT